MSDTPESVHEANIQAIVDAITKESGRGSNRVGIELEHQIVHADGGERVSYDEEHGIRELLERLKETYPDEQLNAEGDLIGVSRVWNGITESLTLEPAGQLELSAGPFNDMERALETFDTFETELAKMLAEVDQAPLLLGYMPVGTAADLELIPKNRYRFMDAHFAKIGDMGRCMMRGSASTQVSVDFANEKDCIRKMRLASAATPLLAMMTDNSLMFEGEMRQNPMARTEMWFEVDPARCGIVPHLFDEGYGLRDYAEYILSLPAIVVPDGNGGWQADERTFAEIYADTPMTYEDAEHSLSMAFNDVRLKSYVEIRPADAMPVEYTIAFATLIKGLFCNDEALAELEKMFEGVTEKDINFAKLTLMEAGFDATVYGQPAWKLMERMHITAKLAVSKDERKLLEPLTTLVFSQHTLAELTVFE